MVMILAIDNAVNQSQFLAPHPALDDVIAGNVPRRGAP